MWVHGEPNSKAAEPWILAQKRFLLEHHHSHYKPQLSPNILFNFFLEEPSGVLHGRKCRLHEWRWRWRWDVREGHSGPVGAASHLVIQFILFSAPVLIFVHVCPWVFFGDPLGWSIPTPAFSGLQLFGFFLPSTHSHRLSNFQKFLEISCLLVTQPCASLCCFGICIWYLPTDARIHWCWSLVHHLELVLLRRGESLTFYRNLQRYNSTTQFYFLPSFHSACYLWLSR